MIYAVNLNLNQNELQNAVLQPLAVAPANPKYGQLYTDSSTHKIKQWDGTKWNVVGAVVENSEVNGKIKIDGVEVEVYELPEATAEKLGGVKQGTGVAIASDGTISKTGNHWEVIPEGAENDIEAINRIVGDVAPVVGDTAVVKKSISTVNGVTKYSYTAYVFEGEWYAMDGNVSAENCILPENIVTAGDYTQVGNVTKNKTATGAIDVAGKSVMDAFKAIFTKELNPTNTAPAVTISDFPAGTYEVGTTVTPKYKATLSKGSYTYGPEATGVEVESWSVTDGATTKDTASGQFDDLLVEDTTNYKITATAIHSDGAIPVTNLGTNYATAQIKGGEDNKKSKTSGAITGFRKFFYGSKTNKTDVVDTDFIRGLTHSDKAVGTSQNFEMEVVEGALRVIVAFPTATGKKLTKVEDGNAFGTDIVSKFVKTTVNVEGANDYAGVSYDVYAYEPDAALSANTYTITIA